jgi:DNA polymerase-3 subunit gamma/tau
VEEPPSIPPAKKSTTQIPSLDTLQTKISSRKYGSEPDTNIKEHNDEPTSEESFSKEDLDKHWQEFIALKKENGKDQEIILLKEPYTLEDNKVVVKLSNEVLNITFSHLKADLQAFLRKALKNKKITLEAIVEETAREDMIYTNKEKFAHLAKKHPVLKDLQDKLGLDPDY